MQEKLKKWLLLNLTVDNFNQWQLGPHDSIIYLKHISTSLILLGTGPMIKIYKDHNLSYGIVVLDDNIRINYARVISSLIAQRKEDRINEILALIGSASP